MAEDWTKAMWCPYTADHTCAANIPAACICRKPPASVYLEAVARARSEPLTENHPGAKP